MCTLQETRNTHVTWQAQTDTLQMLGLQYLFVSLALFRWISRTSSNTSYSTSIAPTSWTHAVLFFSKRTTRKTKRTKTKKKTNKQLLNWCPQTNDLCVWELTDDSIVQVAQSHVWKFTNFQLFQINLLCRLLKRWNFYFRTEKYFSLSMLKNTHAFYTFIVIWGYNLAGNRFTWLANFTEKTVRFSELFSRSWSVYSKRTKLSWYNNFFFFSKPDVLPFSKKKLVGIFHWSNFTGRKICNF